MKQIGDRILYFEEIDSLVNKANEVSGGKDIDAEIAQLRKKLDDNS